MLVAALVAVLGACSADVDVASQTTTSASASARDWATLAGKAFQPLASSAQEVPGAVRAWLDGELTGAALREKLNPALADAAETELRVRALPDAPAKSFYLASAELHVQQVRILLRGVDIAHGDAREQVALLGLRVRKLGDRVFDRGHALIDPSFGADAPDVQINLPEEVPDWESEGLAPGPPFDDEPGLAASSPALRADTRPMQPEVDWLLAVEAAGAPNRIDFDGDFAAQARAYVAATEALRNAPDPDVPGGRERSAVLRLSWLVKADAARAAQAGFVDIAHNLDAIKIASP
ncbi:MAG: hypothetical protein H0U92_14450 [Actinobacteria bacterium]|nr:hypothetical protein [Actinomycetota bacterium]